MSSNKEFIVVHAGRRDDYQMALALQEYGMLKCLITEFYSPIDSFFGKFLCRNGYLKKKLHKRYKAGLPSNKVVISYHALFYAILFQITRKIKFDNYKSLALGRKARSISLRNGIPIISMNTYASTSFENNPISPKILFQFHPHPTFVKRLFLEEIELCPKASQSLFKEYEFSIKDAELKQLSNEIWLSEHYICASSVTKRSLLSEGVPPEKIKVIPYGVDLKKFSYLPRSKPSTTFNIIFIGSLNQRKGIIYLLNALKNLEGIGLTIVGRGIFDMSLLLEYNFPINVYHDVTDEKLLSLLHQSHCFVLPSIIEGFGQVILEAMATGIPVVASENTAAVDIITSNKDGFLIPIRNSEAIATSIIKLMSDYNFALEMGKAANLTSKKFTWELFRFQLVKHIGNL